MRRRPSALQAGRNVAHSKPVAGRGRDRCRRTDCRATCRAVSEPGSASRLQALTIADFRKDNGGAIRRVCARFVALCRSMGLFAEETSVAIDGSKFKAVNNRDKNFTRAKMERRLAQIEESVARYLHHSTPPIVRKAGAHDQDDTADGELARLLNRRSTVKPTLPVVAFLSPGDEADAQGDTGARPSRCAASGDR
jgi:hypothetical protein